MPGNPRTCNFRMEHIKFLFPSYELQHLNCSETWTKPEGPGVQRPLGRLAEDQSSSAPAQYLLHSRGFFPLLANEKWLLCLKIVSRRERLELGRPCPFNICLCSAWPWVLLCFKNRSSGVDLCPSLLGCSSPLSSGTTYLFFLHLANPGAAPHIFPKLHPQSWFPRPWGKSDWLENLLFPPALVS